jgi:hypothetical protein
VPWKGGVEKKTTSGQAGRKSLVSHVINMWRKMGVSGIEDNIKRGGWKGRSRHTIVTSSPAWLAGRLGTRHTGLDRDAVADLPFVYAGANLDDGAGRLVTGSALE